LRFGKIADRNYVKRKSGPVKFSGLATAGGAAGEGAHERRGEAHRGQYRPIA
jgi:hypothetical protein